MDIVEKCAKIESLQNEVFGGYKLNEQTGDIYKGKQKITNQAQKVNCISIFIN